MKIPGGIIHWRKSNFSGPFFVPFGDGAVKTQGNYLGAGKPGDGNRASFQANVPNQDTGFMDDVAIGVGGLTELRDGSLWAEDYQGIYQEFGPGEVARSGGRVTGDVGSRQVSWKDENGDPLPQLPRIVHAPEATNTFLNNYTPVTQTVTAPTGTHTCWLEGAGSVTLTGGLTGVVTDGNPVTGDPAGVDVLCTVSGTPDFVMFEDNSAPTAPIPTEGTPETRPECELSFEAANHSDTEGAWLINISPSFNKGEFTNVSVLNASMIYMYSGPGDISSYDGVSVARSSADYSKGELIDIGLAYGSGKRRISANGIDSPENNYDGSFSAPGSVCKYAPAVITIGEIARYDVDYDTAKQIIDGG